jgi:hypothetical protein
MDSLLGLFCDVDDFCKAFLPIWQQQQLADGKKHRQRPRSLTISEVMTILIASCYAGERPLRPSLTSSKTFRRLSTPAIAVLPTSLSTYCVA